MKVLKKKKEKKSSGVNYSNTKVKARNFLTNISYRRLNKNDYINVSFTIDCYSFIVQNLNLFLLGKKFNSNQDQNYVNMMWVKCIPNELYKVICLKEKFMLLNLLEVTYEKANKIVMDCTAINPNKTRELYQYFHKVQVIYQYVYSMIFPKHLALN